MASFWEYLSSRKSKVGAFSEYYSSRKSVGDFGGIGGFGLSNIRVGMSGEVERQRLDILERMKRTTDSRAKSRLTLPRLLGDGKTEKNILADIL